MFIRDIHIQSPFGFHFTMALEFHPGPDGTITAKMPSAAFRCCYTNMPVQIGDETWYVRPYQSTELKPRYCSLDILFGDSPIETPHLRLINGILD